MSADRYDGFDEILRQLKSLRRRRRRLRLAAGAMAVATVALSALLTATIAVGYWSDQPPTSLRRGLLVVGGLAVAAAIVWFVLRPLLQRENLAQTARFAETLAPELDNDLINSVLLADDSAQPSKPLVQAAIREAAGHVASVDLSRKLSTGPLRRWSVALAVVAVLTTLFLVAQPAAFQRGLLAVLSPGRYVPAVNEIELLRLEPGDATCFAGESLAIIAEIRNESASPRRATVQFEGASARRGMLANEDNTRYTLPIARLDQSFRYRLRIDASRWPTDRPWYTVRVIQRAEVEGLDVRYTYPSYTAMAERTVVNSSGHLEAPIGSRARLTLKLSTPVPQGIVEMQTGVTVAMDRQRDGAELSAIVPIDADGSYRIVLRDKNGRAIQQLPDGPGDRPTAGANPPDGQYRITAIPDAPPQVKFLSPARDIVAAMGETVAMKIQAADNYGLASLRLTAWLDGDDGKRLLNESFALAPGRTGKLLDYAFIIPADLNDGRDAAIVYRAEATDNRTLPGAGPQTATTETFRILIRPAGKVAADRANAFEQLRSRLLAILRIAEAQRVNTEICRVRHTRLDQVRATGKEIHAAQQAVAGELGDLAENFAFPPGASAIRRAIALLSINEAPIAIEQAKLLATLADLAARQDTAARLAGTQNRIIHALHTLLAIAPAMGSSPAERNAPEPDGDIPPEIREKLSHLKGELEKFIEAQTKIIEASDDLAKRPVDAFTAADEELLQQLIALQDEWEKFLEESFADFSKLARQDYSNPVMLSELIAIKTDVTMAKDALSQKAVEIATAIESVGAENAETLTANLEKWLPDEPDRIKWVMEDPTGQQNMEHPELPTELEDLVGDLLEQEEDLFEQMDDITSMYAISGDKAIGWDATDGPISSMNAQGVTGNQLPNTSEMSGRSGEGRTGKSSGEFVEDKAVGKGGRRTPTRLGGEPFQQGQVNDTSAEPPGGATGGGKLSGAGAEGLEGPIPPPLVRELKRLAGRQAALADRAQRMWANFRTDDYSGFRFGQAVTLMNRVRSDLEHNRYHNALRARRETLAALRQTHALLSGRIDVEADNSNAMPKYVRQNISDAMRGPLPAAYREALQQYYRRISEAASGDGANANAKN